MPRRVQKKQEEPAKAPRALALLLVLALFGSLIGWWIGSLFSEPEQDLPDTNAPSVADANANASRTNTGNESHRSRDLRPRPQDEPTTVLEDDPAPEETLPPGVEFEAISGPTAWVQRLHAGSQLRKLETLWKTEEISTQLAASYSHLLSKHLLSVDALSQRDVAGYFAPPPITIGNVNKVFAELVLPYRDLSALFVRIGDGEPTKLSKGAEAQKAFTPRVGAVRLWSTSEAIPNEVAMSAQIMLDELCRVADVTYPQGFDLLISDQLGADLFPITVPAINADGLYFIHDQFAAVRASLSSDRMESVSRHELVHAFTYQLGPDFESSRFISEGLAEYLRLVLADPKSLKSAMGQVDELVPTLTAVEDLKKIEAYREKQSAKPLDPAITTRDYYDAWSAELAQITELREAAGKHSGSLRAEGEPLVNIALMRHELAALTFLLDSLEKAQGNRARDDKKRLRKFLELSPLEFYSLGAFGYLMAQACMAYVGEEVVLDALGKRNDKVIYEALKNTDWDEFHEWLTEQSRGGIPGLANPVFDRVDDREREAKGKGWNDSESLYRTLTRELDYNLYRSRTKDLLIYGLDGELHSLDDALNSIPVQEFASRRASRTRVFTALQNRTKSQGLSIFTERSVAMSQESLPAQSFGEFNVSAKAFNDFTGGSKLDLVSHLLREWEISSNAGNLESWNFDLNTPFSVRPPVLPEDEQLVFVKLPAFLNQQKRGDGQIVMIVNGQFNIERGVIERSYNVPKVGDVTTEEREAYIRRALSLEWAAELKRQNIAPDAVLVIGLGGEADDAETLAEAYRMALGGRAYNVAVWRPTEN